KTAADFRGKKIATPQLGNTQDISCRAWLKAQGFKVTLTGGDVIVRRPQILTNSVCSRAAVWMPFGRLSHGSRALSAKQRRRVFSKTLISLRPGWRAA